MDYETIESSLHVLVLGYIAGALFSLAIYPITSKWACQAWVKAKSYVNQPSEIDRINANYYSLYSRIGTTERRLGDNMSFISELSSRIEVLEIESLKSSGTVVKTNKQNKG